MHPRRRVRESTTACRQRLAFAIPFVAGGLLPAVANATGGFTRSDWLSVVAT